MYNPKTSVSEDFNLDLIETNDNIRDKRISFIKSDNCIGPSIKRGEYWELWMLEYIKNYYKPGTNMIDLGANIGTTTLLMSEVLSPDCKIFSFEPLFSDVLIKNVLDNGLSERISVYPYGVGKGEDVMRIMKLDLTWGINYGALSICMNNI